MPISLDLHPEPVTVTLDCDDAPEADRVRWLVRPLTGPDLEAARARSGAMPYRGARVREELRTRAGGAPGAEPSPEALARELRALDPEDAAALEAFGSWSESLDLEVAAAALVAVDGVPVDDARAALDTVRPASLRSVVLRQLAEHARAVAELDPTARASYGCGSGATPTGGAGAGAAQSAPQTARP